MLRISLSPVLFVCILGMNSMGSSLTTFGIAAWIFHVTGSYSAMTLLGIITPLTVLLFAPIAGLASDRYEKKKILIAADSLSCVSLLLSLTLYRYGLFGTLQAITLALCLACANEFRYTASASLIPEITPKDALLKVNSVQQVFRGGSLILGPILGAVGFDYLGLPLLLGSDALTFVTSATLLLCCTFSVTFSSPLRLPKSPPVIAEIRQSLLWLLSKRPLVTLLLVFMLINALLSIFMVALTPYVLNSRSNLELGLVSAAIGAGMLLSGLSMARLKKRIHPVYLLIASTFILGFSFIAIGLAAFRESLWLLTPLVGASVALLASSNQTIWHTHTPQDIQGKIIALRSITQYLMTPTSLLLSAPAVSSLITPIVNRHTSAALLWGNGLTGSLGLMISVIGTLLLGVGSVTLFSRHIRKLIPAPRETRASGNQGTHATMQEGITDV
ncbi:MULTISPECIES: MFS transporter [unclassified Pseudomonas]|uniref:MFS transporter n=1 Tax=unclassified Pseudomonas TaxID=196821 RepID=UPI000CD1EC6E|nr:MULTISPECIES: MFS transporter [unclassified Pseudomonas]POA51837.1 hypothetical protein C1889_25615 [Pseudomonas sp. FW507-12TSA]